MKRTIGAFAANWLRNPQNQEKIKRGARQLWSRYQRFRNGSGSATQTTQSARTGRPPNTPSSTDRD